MNQDYMKTKPILPLVLSMSLPMVLSMLVNSLYNIVDSFFEFIRRDGMCHDTFRLTEHLDIVGDLPVEQTTVGNNNDGIV